MNKDSAVNLYNRRAKSITNGGMVPGGAAPSSGQAVMLNDTSEKNLKAGDNNEVVFVGGVTPTNAD